MWVVGHKDVMLDNNLKVIACVQSSAPHLGVLPGWPDTGDWHIAVTANNKTKLQPAFFGAIRPAGQPPPSDSLSSLTTNSNTSIHWAELEQKIMQMEGPCELGADDLWSPLVAGHCVFAVPDEEDHTNFYYYTTGSHYAYETLNGVRPLRLLNIGGATHSANVAANTGVVCCCLQSVQACGATARSPAPPLCLVWRFACSVGCLG